jgi:hypothetical protein
VKLKNRFNHRFNETDLSKRNWVENTSIDEALKKLEALFEGTFIVEELFIRHWLYCASCSPCDTTTFEIQELVKVLDSASAGDIIQIWTLSDSDSDPEYIQLCCPNQDGLFPTKGAY